MLIYTTRTGSFLYGTHTPTSDVDLKHIVLPPLETLLLGQGVKNKVKKTNRQANTKNSANDVDEEFIPLQTLVSDFLAGQSYAVELVYSALSPENAYAVAYAESGIDFRAFARGLLAYRTKDIKAMVGYAIHQANLYSIKGGRLKALKDSIAALEAYLRQGADPQANLKQAFARDDGHGIRVLEAANPDYVKLDRYWVNAVKQDDALVVLGKTYPLSNALLHTHRMLTSNLKHYGERSEQAMQANAVDHKALMHAVRIARQALKLVHGQDLRFPLPADEVAHLLAIKHGEVPVRDIYNELDALVGQLKTDEKTAFLPTAEAVKPVAQAWLVQQLKVAYGLALSTGMELA